MQKSKRKFKILYKKSLLFKKNINNNKIQLSAIINIKNINYTKSMSTSNINKIIINKFYNTNLQKLLGPTNKKL